MAGERLRVQAVSTAPVSFLPLAPPDRAPRRLIIAIHGRHSSRQSDLRRPQPPRVLCRTEEVIGSRQRTVIRAKMAGTLKFASPSGDRRRCGGMDAQLKARSQHPAALQSRPSGIDRDPFHALSGTSSLHRPAEDVVAVGTDSVHEAARL